MHSLPRLQHFQDGGGEDGGGGGNTSGDSWGDSTGFSDFGTSWGDTTTSGNWADSAAWSDPGASWSDAGSNFSDTSGGNWAGNNAGVSYGQAGVGDQGFGTGTFATDTSGSNFSGDMGGGGGWGTPSFSDYGGAGGGYYGGNDFGGGGTYGDFGGGGYYGGGFDTYSGAPYADMGANYTSPSGMDLAGDFGINAANMGNSLAGVTGGMPSNQYGLSDPSGRTYDPTSPALTDPQSLSNVSAAFPVNPNNPFMQAYDFLSNLSNPFARASTEFNPDVFEAQARGEQGRAGMNLDYSDLYEAGPPPAQNPMEGAIESQGFTPTHADPMAGAIESQGYQGPPAMAGAIESQGFQTPNAMTGAIESQGFQPPGLMAGAIESQGFVPPVTQPMNVEVVPASQAPASVMAANPAANLNQQQIAQEQQQSPALNLDPVNIEASRAVQETPQAPSNAQEVAAEATPAATVAAHQAADQTGAPPEAADAAGKAAGDAVSRGADHPTTQQAATGAAFQSGADQPQSEVIGQAAADAAVNARDAVAVPSSAPPASLPTAAPPTIPATSVAELQSPAITNPYTGGLNQGPFSPSMPGGVYSPGERGPQFDFTPGTSPPPPSGPTDYSGKTFARYAPSDTLSNLLDMLNPISRAEARGREHGRFSGRIDRVASRVAPRGGGPGAATTPGAINATELSTGQRNVSDMKEPPVGLVVHHTSAEGKYGVQNLINTFHSRGYPAQYFIDRDGKLYQYLADNKQGAHTKSSYGPIGKGLGNQNLLGVEIIANDNNDVTPAQVKTATELYKGLADKYGWANPASSIFGHGELNPGHKEADEGMKVVNEVRGSGVVAQNPFGSSAPPQAGRGPGASRTASRANPGAPGRVTPVAGGPTFTFYGPGGRGKEGGFVTAKPDKEGNRTPHTLDDVRLGKSDYVTIAGGPATLGKEFTLPPVRYQSPIDGKTYTLEGVKGFVHDVFDPKNPDYRNSNRFDVATGDFRGKTSAESKGLLAQNTMFAPGHAPTAVAAKAPAAPPDIPPANPPFISLPPAEFLTPGMTSFAGREAAPQYEGTEADYGQNYGRPAAETGPYQTTETDYGYNYGAGPPAVGALAPGWAGLSMLGARSGEFPASPSLAPVGYPVTPVERGVLPDIPPPLQGYPVAAVERGALPDIPSALQGYPVASVERGTLPDIPETLQGYPVTAVERGMLPDIVAPPGWLANQQQVGIRGPQEFPAGPTFFGPEGVEADYGMNYGPGVHVAGPPLSLAPEFAGAPSWDEAGMTVTGKGDLPLTSFDARFGDWPAAYAGPFAGPDVVGGRAVAEAPPAWPGLSLEGVRSAEFATPPSRAEMQAELRGAPTYARVFDNIISNIPAAQRSDFGKTLNNLSDTEKASILSRGPQALVDMIAKGTGRDPSQITSWINGSYGWAGYPGYPGGMQALGRDLAAAREASVTYGGRTGFPVASADIADTRGFTGLADQPQTAVAGKAPAPPPDIPPSPPATVSPPSSVAAPPSAPPSVSAPPSTPTENITPSQQQGAQEAARTSPQIAEAIYQANPDIVGYTAERYRVDIYTAAMLLALIWAGQQPSTMAEGGRVDFDTREYYMPNAHKGQGGWPRIMAPESGRGWSRTLGAEMMRQQESYTYPPDIRVDRANFQRWLAAQPRSTNIEDRRYYDPTRDEAAAGPPAFQTGGALHFQEWGQEEDEPGWR